MRSLCIAFILIITLTSSGFGQQESISKLQDDFDEAYSIEIEIPPLDSTVLKQMKTGPGSFIFYAQRGQYYFKKGQLDSSEFFYKIALALCDTIPAIYNMLGEIELQREAHKIIPFEKLLSLLKRDSKSKAIKYFKRALKLNPKYPDARYNLGCAYLKKGGKKNLKRAETEFLKLLSYLPNYQDATYQLARVYQEKKDFDRAIEIYRKLSASERDLARAFIRLSEIFLELGIQDAACRSYFNGIEKLTDKNMLNELYLDIELLLTPEEKEVYQTTSPEQKGFFFKKFWKRRDPTPETVVNERLVEHFQRVKFARATFHFTVPPYYDDRGKIYIKYGPPAERYVSPVGNIQVKPNESWSYENIHENLVFDFVDDGGVFHLVQDLRQAAFAGAGYSGELYVAQQLYGERTHLSGVYARFGTGLDESKLVSFQSYRMQALNETPPEVYRYDYKSKPLPIVSNYAQFKGENDSTEIDFYFSLPSRLLKYEENTGDKISSYVEYVLILNDSLYNDILNKKQAANLMISKAKNEAGGNFILQQTFALNSGNYHLVLKIKNDASNRLGLYRFDLPVKGFDADRLCLSDLKLASKISPRTERSNPMFVRHSFQITPHPFNSVLHKQPINLYYEIYNLKLDENGQAKYRIEYRAKTIKEKSSFWGKALKSVASVFGSKISKSLTLTYDRKAKQRNIHEYLAFDFSNLVLGETELEVLVQDLNSSEETKSVIQFTLIEQ